MKYYTDREYGQRPRTQELINEVVWRGIISLVKVRITDSSFGWRFPEACVESSALCGCDIQAFSDRLAAEVPWAKWPLEDDVPDTPIILDLLEFFASSVGEPESYFNHSYRRHDHLRWNREAGLAKFIEDANLLFQRGGIAFELDRHGAVRRLLPDALNDVLGWAKFQTGDGEMDRLLEAARRRIQAPKLDDRRVGLESLWDAFERMKTLEGPNKAQAAEALLDRVAAPGSKMRAQLNVEAKALTEIGNTFRIRHSEVTQEHIEQAETIDWLFGRAFGFVHFILRRTGRAT